MICKIADLIVEIPDTEDMLQRCGGYLCESAKEPDIRVLYEKYPLEKNPDAPRDAVIYFNSGAQFYRQLLEHDGLELHSSAVEYQGRAYLFSGASGMGKSTHAAIWTRLFEGARIINDDKPALRCIDGRWYAYGTPWSGKTRQNINVKVPVAGICFLERGESNSIRRLTPRESVVNIIAQTVRRKLSADRMALMFDRIEALMRDIPVFELHCLPDEDAAKLSYETMYNAALERNL